MDRAIDFLRDRKRRERPFFLYFTPALPHADLDAKEEDRETFEGAFCERPIEGNWYLAETQPKATYAGMIRCIDKDVRRMIEVLQEEGLTEETLFIFISDNGPHEEGGHDPYFFDGNGPYRGLKRALRGRCASPLHSCMAGSDQAGEHLLSYACLLGRDADSPGVERGGDSGADRRDLLRPTLIGRGEQPEHPYLYWEFHEEGGRQAVRMRQWKLIRQQVRDASRTYEELYDLSADPGELRDVSADYPEVVRQLSELIDRSHLPSKDFLLLPQEK